MGSIVTEPRVFVTEGTDIGSLKALGIHDFLSVNARLQRGPYRSTVLCNGE